MKSARSWGRLGMKCKLSDICAFRKGKVRVSILTVKTYISTENMMPNKCGITEASSLPTVSLTQEYNSGDVLVSNIRPYFKKIWQAEYDGGCSNDVLVFVPKPNTDKDFLYYVLADDDFFTYSMATSKGTKMPRGDKTSIMQYEVPLIDLQVQKKIASVLKALDEKIKLNNEINNNLEQQAQAIYKAWFVDFSAFGGTAPNDWQTYHLVDFLPVITGKKNANVSSDQGKYPFFSCSQDYAWTDDYSFDGSAILVAGNGDFNVKFYSGKFEAYQRTYVLIPYEPKYTAWLFYAVQYHLSSITSAARGSVIKFITKGNLEDFEFVAPKLPLSLPVIYNLDTINRKIAANREENLRLGTLRDTLLPKLMSGELDVSNVEI